MLTLEQRKQHNEYLEEIFSELDITKTQYEFAIKSYQAVGRWLSAEDSKLFKYEPDILPQGSFLLGTMIKPILEGDELDVDLVCRLSGKESFWTQEELKKIIGDRLKDNESYKAMLDEEGRRCWTLLYSDSSKYHMDILPSIVSDDYKTYMAALNESFSAYNTYEVEKTAIRLTDNELENYKTETNPEYWHKSNPFGYAAWFQEQCKLTDGRGMFLNEAINPIPNHRKEKSPLQRVVQILKRHRDIKFNGEDDKPISIIITTLAARSYNKETDILTALENIVNSMEHNIESRYSEKHGREISWISNPINDEENFADKWAEKPRKKELFYKWLGDLKSNLNGLIGTRDIQGVKNSLSEMFGDNVTVLSFENIANRTYKSRESGKLFMEGGTGILGVTKTTKSVPVKKHTFHGKNTK